METNLLLDNDQTRMSEGLSDDIQNLSLRKNGKVVKISNAPTYKDEFTT